MPKNLGNLFNRASSSLSTLPSAPMHDRTIPLSVTFSPSTNNSDNLGASHYSLNQRFKCATASCHQATPNRPNSLNRSTQPCQSTSEYTHCSEAVTESHLNNPSSSQCASNDNQDFPPTRHTTRQRKLRPPLFKFPLHYPKALPDGPPPPPYLSYNLEASYHIDGSSITEVLASEDPARTSRDRSKRGACAFVKYMPKRINIYAAKVEDASNNAAEFSSLEEALKDAVKSEHRSILIVTDSQLTFDLLIDADYRITRPHLKVIADRIKLLLKNVPTVYVSKVFSHRSGHMRWQSSSRFNVHLGHLFV
jgi:ribonuclease HI